VLKLEKVDGEIFVIVKEFFDKLEFSAYFKIYIFLGYEGKGEVFVLEGNFWDDVSDIDLLICTVGRVLNEMCS